MKKTIIMLGAVAAWVCGAFGATHEGVQLWENGPLWAKTNVGANSPTETGYYFWWGDGNAVKVKLASVVTKLISAVRVVYVILSQARPFMV